MRRRCFLLAVLWTSGATLGLSLWQSRCLAGPEAAKMVQAEFVQPPKFFVRDTATIQYSCPTVVRLASGKLVMNMGGTFESADGGRTWTPIKTDAWLDSRSVIRLRDGRWAAVVGRPSPLGFSGSQPMIRFSADEAKSWSKPVEMAHQDGIYYVLHERLIETSRGALVVAVSRGSGVYEGDNNTAGCFYSTDGGKTWSLTETWARLEGHRGMQEAVIAELTDGRLYMLARTGKGSHHRSYSSDGGRTWLAPQPTTLTAACSPLAMKKMPDGRLLVVYNHAKPIEPASSEAFFPRRPLVWAVSSDDGTTWSPPHVICAEEGQQHIYPSITFLDHGILIVYSSEFAYDDGQFGGPPDGWKIGGGKSCILKYPLP